MRTLGATVFVFLAAGASPAEVVDSIVAVVGQHAIKKSDVMKQIRLTAFLNQEPANFGPEAQEAAADRLIDQALIRDEILARMYIMRDADAEPLLKQLQESYATPQQFSDALGRYGISQGELLGHLNWQARVLEFVQLRFGGSQRVNEDFFAWLDQMRAEKRIQIRKERLR